MIARTAAEYHMLIILSAFLAFGVGLTLIAILAPWEFDRWP